ncbi:MAG: Xaa-Pro aminopeptidase/Xaa-Pro dipeptidase [Phycisphaerales bacterium]|jgi:Xaa-Pro aminopeptidase|nr:Xaa-Pro aminopeptidase/Xaa-Pro dipeptidase [Phycisphaerales bacterium]
MQTKPVVSRAKAYLKVRQKSVRDAMKQLKLDGLLLTHAPDLAYLTNFTGEDSVGLITDKEFHLITDFRYQEQAESEAGWLKIAIRDGKMAETLAKVLAETNASRVGFEANFTTFGQIDAVDRAIKERKEKGTNGNAQPVELIPLEDVMFNIRKVKDDNEIDLVRKSVEIAEQAFDAIRSEIKVGQTENYLAGQLIAELRSRGASATSFPVIFAAGANSSLPHYRPGDREVQVLRDQPLLIDWGAVYRGYCSDLTRTMMVGRVSAKIKQIHKVVLEAQDAAIRFLRPGVTTMQADRVARDVIERAGFGKEFGHGLGHGIGREIHELPRMSKTGGEEELRPGMIITVEPGIYLPGEGGVRIEDDVLITHSGCEVLSSLDRTFEGCHLE